MALKTDHSSMPKPRKEGAVPDATSRFAPLLAAAWASNVDTEERAFSIEGRRIRHSWAASCARLIGYRIRGEEPSDPMTVADYWRMGLGTKVHDLWQEILQQAFSMADVEVKVGIDEIESAGHIDAVITESMTGYTTALELKTINGFGFKMAIGARGEAEGARWSAVVQGALNAKAVDADELVIVYLSMECLSPRELKKIGAEEWQRFAAEWTFTREEYEPIAEAEMKRMARILEIVDAGDLPPRQIPDPEIPKGARVTDPSTGTWQQIQDNKIIAAGTTWHCGYCSQRSRCLADG